MRKHNKTVNLSFASRSTTDAVERMLKDLVDTIETLKVSHPGNEFTMVQPVWTGRNTQKPAWWYGPIPVCLVRTVAFCHAM